MQCPVDGATLTMSERGGIEIDYCPTCRGVWLDRGELDKIIDRSMSQPAAAPAPPPGPAAAPQQSYQQPYQQPYQQQPYRQGYQKPYHHKKKKSWLSEIFDD